MKSLSRTTFCALALALGGASVAHAELSFNLGVVSLYKYNGIDQDSRTPKSIRPAVQGGVDKVFDNGFYVGNWNSTGRFGEADIEIDLYGGHRGQITEAVGYDVGVIRYLYPNSGGGWNGSEVYATLTVGGLTAKYADGVSGSIKEQGRFSLRYDLALNEHWKAQATVGFGTDERNFNDYALGLTRDMGHGLSLGLQLAGATNKALHAEGRGDDRLIVSLVKGF